MRPRFRRCDPHVGSVGLGHAREQEFYHVARDVCEVGFFFVQDVVVDECDGSRGSRCEEVFSLLVAGGDVLRSGGYAGRSHFAGCVLGIVHGHHPAAVVVAAVLVGAEPAVVQAVFVHGACIAAGPAFVNVAVQVQIIIGSEDAGECAVNDGVIPYVLQFWYGGK